jgi:dihydrofolate reductase
MSMLTAVVHLTLDGVMQAPGRPDEDTRDGFRHGGWAASYNDHVMAEAMGRGMAAGLAGGALLLGRRTYEDFASFWPRQTDNPFTPVLAAMTKYVVSNTAHDPLPWENSTVLPGDAARSVSDLKQQSKNLVVLGSGELLSTLVSHDLVDEFLLTIHPLVLGSGRRLFTADGHTATLQLVNSTTTTTGVLIGTYRPVRANSLPA